MDREELKILIQNNPKLLKFESRTLHPATIAEIVSNLPLKKNTQILKTLPLMVMADVFSYFEFSLQVEIFKNMNSKDRASLITHMYHDDRVDLIKKLPEELSKNLLESLADKVRQDIQELSAYKEKTAGSLMTSEYLCVPDNLTAAQTIDYLRSMATGIEALYDIYIIDLQHKLIGSITLKDLILAPPSMQVKNFMIEDLVYAHATDSRESATRKIAKYDVISLPVVDKDGVLLGIITHDDAFDALDSEYNEDIEKFMAISGTHANENYLSVPVVRHFSNRIVWVVILAFIGLLSGFVLHKFEETLSSLVILALYMPMLMDTGGNTGSQAATIVIRSLAIGTIKGKDLFLVLWKELRVSLLISIVIGILAFIRVLFLSRNTVIPDGFSLMNIAGAIAVALSIQVVSATLIGAILPLLVDKAKMDPAVVASPAITTMVDITGLIIYFTTATLMLGL